MLATRMRQAAAGNSAVDWWLAGGITPSTSYTVYDPMVAADEAASFVNLANPGTRNAVKSGTVTFTAGVGWTGNGTTGYFDTGHVVTQNTTIITMHKNSQSGRFICGVTQASPNRSLAIAPYSSTNVTWYRSQSFTGSASRHPAGVLALNSTNAYRDGVRDTSVSGTWSGSATTRTIKLLAYDDGTVKFFNGGTLHRVAIYDFLLSDAQVEAVTYAMMADAEAELHSYSQAVLSLTPTLYLPCNIKPGFHFARDYSGNKKVAAVITAGADGWNGVTDGQFGNALNCSAGLNEQIIVNTGTNYAGMNAFNLDECSISMWLRLHFTAPLNQKLIEIWRTGGVEYIAYEIRNTDDYTIFTRANGASQIVSAVVSGAEGVWEHLVFYNSVSEGVVGLYHNGVDYSTAKTNGATTATTNQLCEIGVIDGDIQHIAIYDHKLTQGEVNTLYPGT